ncbi:MAG: SMP-30/gluconolactonase/LRE family protein [Chlamydiota bacterium]
MKVATPIVDVDANLGEGAIWDSKSQILYWLDINSHKIFTYDPSSNTNRSIDVHEYPSTIVPRESGGVVITIKNGFASLDLDTGKMKMIAEVENDIEDTRFNDGKCDPTGRFWAGTMQLNHENGRGSLYVLDIDHSVRKLLSNVSCSNGIVWSFDNRTMYYIDSLRQAVHAYDYNNITGTIDNERVVISIPIEEGIPDGSTIDSEGMIWVAIFGGSKVNRYDPRTGEKIDTVEVPNARCVTSCALGGADFRDLYITTSKALFIYENDNPQKHSLGGWLFKTRVDVPGIPAISYKG